MFAAAGVASAAACVETTVGDGVPTVAAAIMFFSALGNSCCSFIDCRSVLLMAHFVIFSFLMATVQNFSKSRAE